MIWLEREHWRNAKKCRLKLNVKELLAIFRHVKSEVKFMEWGVATFGANGISTQTLTIWFAAAIQRLKIILNCRTTARLYKQAAGTTPLKLIVANLKP